ncbi:recombinase family protein [Lachnospiraceae bacterium C1.1]|nr:recombinase family protein [Lachnospiraceae bacterium C1.1]
MEQKILGYVRVSSKDQNADRQIIAMREMGVPEKNIFVDKITGRNFERPQYKRMIKKLNSNSVLYIKSIDRLGRSYRELCEQWRIITKDKGADVVVIDMPILDTRREKNLVGTLISDLVLALLSYAAESEYSAIHSRQAEGIAAAKARGIKFGRKPIPLPANFHEVYQKWKMKKVTIKEAAEMCGMAQSTFYDRAHSYENVSISK